MELCKTVFFQSPLHGPAREAVEEDSDPDLRTLGPRVVFCLNQEKGNKQRRKRNRSVLGGSRDLRHQLSVDQLVGSDFEWLMNP